MKLFMEIFFTAFLLLPVLGVFAEFFLDGKSKQTNKPMTKSIKTSLLSCLIAMLASAAFGLGSCVTNCTVGILSGNGNNIPTMQQSNDWCPWIQDDPFNWHGTCAIALESSCTNTEWSGTPLQLSVHTVSDLPIIVGMISIDCSNGGHDQSAIWMPAYCGNCTFHFFATCSGTNCTVHICPNCNGYFYPPPSPE